MSLGWDQGGTKWLKEIIINSEIVFFADHYKRKDFLNHHKDERIEKISDESQLLIY